MEIDAPFTVSVMEKEHGEGRELHVTFTAAFRALDITGQGSAMMSYVTGLRRQAQIAEPDSREQMGMLTVLQLAEQMLPHIQAGEMDIDQTIIAEIAADEEVKGKPIWQQLNS
jgi:hypothetical protein